MNSRWKIIIKKRKKIKLKFYKKKLGLHKYIVENH